MLRERRVFDSQNRVPGGAFDSRIPTCGDGSWIPLPSSAQHAAEIIAREKIEMARNGGDLRDDIAALLNFLGWARNTNYE